MPWTFDPSVCGREIPEDFRASEVDCAGDVEDAAADIRRDVAGDGRAADG